MEINSNLFSRNLLFQKYKFPYFSHVFVVLKSDKKDQLNCTNLYTYIIYSVYILVFLYII